MCEVESKRSLEEERRQLERTKITARTTCMYGNATMEPIMLSDGELPLSAKKYLTEQPQEL